MLISLQRQSGRLFDIQLFVLVFYLPAEAFRQV